MSARFPTRPTLHWGARVKELFLRSGIRSADFASALDTDHNTVASWLWKDKRPTLSSAVRVSNRTGFRLVRLISAKSLPKRRDFAPNSENYEHGSWPRGLRASLPGLSDNAIALRIGDRSLMPERVPQSWFYDLEVPLLASAVEAALALELDLDDTLALGRST
jgi:hypothetical protein